MEKRGRTQEDGRERRVRKGRKQRKKKGKRWEINKRRRELHAHTVVSAKIWSVRSKQHRIKLVLPSKLY